MSDRTTCPPPEMLCQLIDGKIEDPVMTELTRHLDECPACQNRVPTLLTTDTLVNTLRSDSTVTERMSAVVPQPLIDALMRIPVLDSSEKLSADGLSQNRGMSLDDLGLSFLTPPQEPDEIGRLGHYRVLQVLGRGGMGIVFLAEDSKLGRRVALKVMLPRIANIPVARDRFLREAKAAASLKSDHIVTVYQVDEANGVPFLAMELLQGESLDQSLRSGRRFSISETIQIVRDIAKGLADAHAKGLVHRDIKPANLWLEQSPEGMRVKILDFGLARAELDDVHMTEFGTIVGTPAFMSPEQGYADRPIDSRADLFAIGSVLYLLCTGEMPFQAETTVGILTALALKNPIPPSQRNESVPAELSRLTMHLLEKDPGDRPQSARDVLDQLRQLKESIDSADTKTGMTNDTLLGGSKPISASTKATGQPARKSTARSLEIAVAAFIAALAILAGVILWPTNDGRIVRIECNDPSIKLAFEDGELKVTGAYDEPITLKPGKVDLKITKPQSNGEVFEFESDKLVVRKGDKIALKIEVLDGEIRIVQDGKGVVDSASLPVASSLEEIADKNRRAATWVLSAGGVVTIELLLDAAGGTPSGNPFAFKSIDELPSQSFVVTAVRFLNSRPVDGKGFVNLRDLKFLNTLIVEGPGVGDRVDDAAFENLRGCIRLTQFQTAGCEISDKTLAHLKDLPEVSFVGIGNKPGTIGITDAGIITLKAFPKLQELYIGGANLTDAGLGHFRDFKKLQSLGLGGIKGLTDEGLAHVAELKTLRILDLVGTNAGDATAKTLSENRNLAELGLAYTQVSDQGLESLQTLKALKVLWLNDAKVSAASIARFKAAVPECVVHYEDPASSISNAADGTPHPNSTEQFANLIEAMRGANPGFDGAMVPTFERGLLVGLGFKTDHVSDISPLREFKHLRTLRMDGNYTGETGVFDLTPLRGLPLAELYVDGNTRLSDLSPLRGLQLQELHTDGCPIADFGPLAGMPLKVLKAWLWTGTDLSPLKGMPLTEINVGGTGKALDLSPLAGAPLEFLCCNYTGVSDLAPLRGMPLKTLFCEGTQVSDLSPIQDMQLREIAAGKCPITDFSVLARLPLQWAKFDIVPDRDLKVLREIKSLVRINDQRAADYLREASDQPIPRPVSPAFTNSLGMEFVQVPKGQAWLPRRVANVETTIGHETTFEDDFYLGMYEVTQAEWVQVMGSNPSWFARQAEGADAVRVLPDDRLSRLPVERVSWIDCQLFLKKLNELDSQPGWVYRLPTLAEWQYACRGGPMTDPAQGQLPYNTGSRTNTLTPDDANIQHDLGWNRPCRVGLFPPNNLGLYDMHGNVFEWCDELVPGSSPPCRFVVGGGWRDAPGQSSASRIECPTEPWLLYDLGLRVARVPAK